MDQSLNSYRKLAENEYQYIQSDLKRSEEVGNYNRVAVSCQQCAEKYFKAVIQGGFEGTKEIRDILHRHNFRQLHQQITSKYELSVDSKDCKWLGDFYYDARYPGDDFVEVSRDDALECVRITESIRSDSLRILQLVEEEKEITRRKNDDAKTIEELDLD